MRVTLFSLTILHLVSNVHRVSADEYSKIFANGATRLSYVTQEELKRFLAHTMQGFMQETGGEIEIFADLGNKTANEVQKLRNLVSDFCECEMSTCGCCAHVEGKNSSTRNPPSFCVGVYGVKKPSPFLTTLVQVCVKLQEIHVTSSYLNACVRLQSYVTERLVAEFSVGCLYISRNLGKWIARSEESNDICNLDDVPMRFNISYRLSQRFQARPGVSVLEIPESSRGNGICNETDWTMVLTWPSPRRDVLNLLTWEYHQDRDGNATTTIYINNSNGGQNPTRLTVENNQHGLMVPQKMLQCCRKFASSSAYKDDEVISLSFVLSFQGETRPEDASERHDFIWVFGFVSLVVLVLLLVLVTAIRCRRCCRR